MKVRHPRGLLLALIGSLALALPAGAGAAQTEEAIVNALIAARTTEGFAGHRAIELSHDRLRAVLAKYNRLRR